MLKKIIKKNYYIVFIFKYLVSFKNKILYKNSKKAEKYLEKKYKKFVKKEINISKQVNTFTEKIQYRKLYPESTLLTNCTDKNLVKEYVKKKIGEEYLIPQYLVTDKLTEYHWKKLPNSFVIKTNHDSGNIIIIKNKMSINIKNIKKIINKMNLSMKINFGWLMLEKHYIGIKPKIIVEKLLLTSEGHVPKDYKFHCFKSKIIIQVIERNFITNQIKMKFYDENWVELGIKREKQELNDIKKPCNLEKMIYLARKLSEDFNYVRVDFYNIEGIIYFGELTFTPASGFMRFEPDSWDRKLGEYWG